MPLIYLRKSLTEVISRYLLILVTSSLILLLQQISKQSELLSALESSPKLFLLGIQHLLPGVLLITSPFSLIIAVLLTLGRLISDFETVALQASGTSQLRIATPFLLIGIVLASALLVTTTRIIPQSLKNLQYLKETIYRKVIEKPVSTRTIHTSFPDTLISINDIDRVTGKWLGVFIIRKLERENGPTHNPTYLTLSSESGQLTYSRNSEAAIGIELSNGYMLVQKDSLLSPPSVTHFTTQFIRIPGHKIPAVTLPIQSVETTELYRRISDKQIPQAEHLQVIVELNKRLSLPVGVFLLVCISLLIRFRLGDNIGKLTSLWTGFIIATFYYLLFAGSQNLALSGALPGHVCLWAPNIILLGLCAWLSTNRKKALPELSTQATQAAAEAKSGTLSDAFLEKKKASIPWKPAFRNKVLSLLNLQLISSVSSFLILSGTIMVTIVLLFTLLDLTPSISRSKASFWTVLTYFGYLTPQIAYTVTAPSILVAIITTGVLLHRSGQFVIYPASGVRTIQMIAVLILPAVCLTIIQYILLEKVLPVSNREQDNRYYSIKGKRIEQAELVFDRKWIYSYDGKLYSIEAITDNNRLIKAITYPQNIPLSRTRPDDDCQIVCAEFADPRPNDSTQWRVQQGWALNICQRQNTPSAAVLKMISPDSKNTPANQPEYPLTVPEGARLFRRTLSESSKMSTAELRQYINRMETNGASVTTLKVSYHRKFSSLWLPVLATFMALPFAIRFNRQNPVRNVAMSLTLYLSFTLTDMFMEILGKKALIPVWLTAWAPITIFFSLSIFLLFRKHR